MRNLHLAVCAVAVASALSTLSATVLLVPDGFPLGINSAIYAAANGDTVSVWGLVGVPPPYTYYENVDLLGKNVLVVNRSFLPNGGRGYDSSWEHVKMVCPRFAGHFLKRQVLVPRTQPG
jgi:hypothetical protein